jgi:hypothetical protein
MTLATHAHELATLGAAGGGVPVIRYVEPPLDVGFFLDAAPSLATQRIGSLVSMASKGKGSSKQPVPVSGLNHTLWSACRDFETAAEVAIDGIRRGIFTYHFCKSLRMLGTSATRHKLDSVVSTELKRQGFAQVPQIEGTPAALREQVFA